MSLTQTNLHGIFQHQSCRTWCYLADLVKVELRTDAMVEHFHAWLGDSVAVTTILKGPRGEIADLIEHRRGILAPQNWTSGFCEPMFDRKRKPLVCVLWRERQQEMFQKRKNICRLTPVSILPYGFSLTVCIIITSKQLTFSELYRSLLLSGHYTMPSKQEK